MDRRASIRAAVPALDHIAGQAAQAIAAELLAVGRSDTLEGDIIARTRRIRDAAKAAIRACDELLVDAAGTYAEPGQRGHTRFATWPGPR
jgi:hypothetical protein